MTITALELRRLAADPDGVLHAREGRVERVGVSFVARFPDGAMISAERVREGRDGLTAECTVRLADDALISRARLNLSSLTARGSLARWLAAHATGVGPDWSKHVERFAVGVLDLERRGEPFVVVGADPPAPRRRYRLGPILPIDEPTLLFAPGGTGKSTIASVIAASVATGAVIVGGWIPDPADVLVVDYEADAATWNDRLARICSGAAIEPAKVHYRSAARPLVEQFEELARFVAERRVGLLIVDSVGLASGTAREGSDANETALRMFTALRAIGTTSLLVDHVRGDEIGTDGARSKAYGSVYKVNLARSVFELRRERTPGDGRAEIALIHTKVNDGPKLPSMGLAIEYDGDTGPIRFQRAEIEAPELIEAALSKAERMAMVLRAGALPTARIAAEIEGTESTVRSVLTRDNGRRFHRLSDGRVGLVSHAG